jgi:ubiquinone biosynthesis protein COQ4
MTGFNTRIRPLEACRALRTLIADPDRTDQVFTIIEALSGNTRERLYKRFTATPAGRKIIEQDEDILATLNDRDALQAMPAGSLGHTYARFVIQEAISADGLVQASEDGGRQQFLDQGRDIVSRRLRDTHDLWHIVTGYGRDLIGEAALLSFSYAQTRNPGIGVIVLIARLRLREAPGAGEAISKAYRRGRAAEWLPAADWEALLPLPLEQVRRQLGIGECPPYQEVRSDAGLEAAALATA